MKVLFPYYNFNMNYRKYLTYRLMCSYKKTKNNEEHFSQGHISDHHAMKAYWGSGGIAPLIL
jgi:hypothetical protein